MRIASQPALLILALLLLAAACAICGVGHSGARQLTIVYTNGANGQIRSCNCTKFRYGGYGREATALQGMRKSTPNLVLIEGGDFAGQPGEEQEKLKTDVAVKAMTVLKYSAVVPGEAELRYGLANLRQPGGVRLPIALANVSERATGKPDPNGPYVLYKTSGGVRVAVVGLLGARMMLLTPTPGGVVNIEDPAAALKRIASKIRAKCDVIVAVVHAGSDEAMKVAQTQKADVVICTHPSKPLRMPLKSGNTVELPAQVVGRCALAESGTRSGWSIGRLDLELAGTGPKVGAHRLIYLDRTYSESPSVAGIYDKYNEQVKELALREGQKLRAEVEKTLVGRGFDLASRSRAKVFAGAGTCRQCHQAAYETWEKTGHGRAFQTLQKDKRDFDPECVTCHSTGADRRGGFANAKQTPELVNVQCEACHKPAVAHVENTSAPYGAVEEDTCRKCHTDQMNPDFDYDSMWAKVKH